MSKFRSLKKLAAFAVCTVISVNLALSIPKDDNIFNISAKTIAEIQEERKKNNEKIKELESQIAQYENKAEKEKEYHQTLSQQIDLVQQNILGIDTEIGQIENDMEVIRTNIDALNTNIAVQEEKVESNIEIFKERLCAMYITGNNTLALAILGSADFYDMLSRMEMMNSIAAHDEELVETLKADIATLSDSKKSLDTEMTSLDAKKDQLETRKTEKQDEIEQLEGLMKKSQEEIDRIKLEKEALNKTKEEKEAANAQLQKDEDEINAQIARALEEQRRKKEQEAAAAAAADNANKGGSSGGSSGTTTNPSVPTQVDTSANASGFRWPTPGYYYISSGYGQRWGRLHAGIDIAGGGISGAGVYASKGGTVISVVNSCSHNYPKSGRCCGNGYGNYVTILHEGGYSTLYGHLASACVSVGQQVSAGTLIGYVGCTGHSTGYHLHFEVRSNGVAQNPRNYV